MQISDHCYAITGLAYIPPWSVNSGFVVGNHTTLIVDTSATAHSAATIYGYATALRRTNRLLVLNTEKHFDHVGGNGFFRDRSVEIMAHPGSSRTQSEFETEQNEFNSAIPDATRREFREESIFYAGTTVASPTQLITKATDLDLGDLEVQIILTPGHTPTNLSLYVPSERLVFTGDCVVSGYVPNLDCGSPPDWRLWLQSLNQIERLAPRLIVPGHGPVIQHDVPVQFARMRHFLEEALSSGLTPTASKFAAPTTNPER